MIRHTDDGLYEVSTASGTVLAIVETRAAAERLDGLRRNPLLQLRVSGELVAELDARADNSGVTLPTYVRAILEAHVAGRKKLVYRDVGTGLAAASDETRRAVASIGGRAKKSKEATRE